MGARPPCPHPPENPRCIRPRSGARDCNVRDRRRLRRRARALLFWAARSWSASPSGGARGSGDEWSEDAASAAPFSVPGQLSIGPSQSTSVRLQRTANTLDTLRRALEHSADYAGRSPDSAVCGAAHNFSALCLGARPKPPSRGMGAKGSSARQRRVRISALKFHAALPRLPARVRLRDRRRHRELHPPAWCRFHPMSPCSPPSCSRLPDGWPRAFA